MTRKYSEQKVREALLAGMELEDVFVYKPPDQAFAANTKPADFLVWWAAEPARVTTYVAGAPVELVGTGTAWVEVKLSPAATTFNLAEFPPSQRQGMRTAQALGLPYIVVVYWSSSMPPAGHPNPAFTITTGERVLAALDKGVKSIPRGDFLAECPPGQLASTLRAAILGEWS